MRRITIPIIGLLVLAGAAYYYFKVQPRVLNTPSEISYSPTHEKQATLIALGDISCAPEEPRVGDVCKFPQLAEKIKSENPDAVLLVGDLQYNKGELKNFQQIFDPILGTLHSVSYPVPGNHEYVTTGASGYYQYWNNAQQVPEVVRNDTKGYYSFDLKSWHITGLNSNCEFIGGCDANSAQGTWLKDDLTKHPTRCSIAFWHHPQVSSGRYQNRDDLHAMGQYFWDVLYQNHADIILNGHDHIYERFARQNNQFQPDYFKGVRQFTVGAGGRSHYDLHEQKTANSEFSADRSYGYLKLTLYKATYDWQFIDVNGKVLDNGSSSCSI